MRQQMLEAQVSALLGILKRFSVADMLTAEEEEVYAMIRVSNGT
jgi:hypothetical protein